MNSSVVSPLSSHLTTSTRSNSRLEVVDALRGFALLGILVMNIQAFSMPVQMYFNPFALGQEDATLFDRNGLAYLVAHIFADQKFMTIFALLFGVGITLMSDIQKNKSFQITGKLVSTSKFFMRRHLFLLLIGMAHAYLVWEGDILFSYALCGFFVINFRHKTPRYLCCLAVSLLFVPIVWLLAVGVFVPEQEIISELNESWILTHEEHLALIEIFRGPWLGLLNYRVASALEMQTYLFAIYIFWRVSGLMLIGMALYKSGLFHGGIPSEKIARWVFILLPSGLALVVVGVYLNHMNQWQAFYANFFASHFNYLGSIFIAFSYLLIFVKYFPAFPKVCRNFLGNIGRTALSNYILQSIVCAYIFFGYGLGFFGALDRVEQMAVVFVVWIIQIIFSNLWLRHFNNGPVEWVWRCAVAWKILPIKKC